MDPTEILALAAVGAAYGLVYAVYGIATKKQSDEPIQVKKAIRTVVLFVAAGAVVSVQSGDLTQATIEAHLGEVGVVGIVFDMAWARLRRAGYLGGILGEYQ